MNCFTKKRKRIRNKRKELNGTNPFHQRADDDRVMAPAELVARTSDSSWVLTGETLWNGVYNQLVVSWLESRVGLCLSLSLSLSHLARTVVHHSRQLVDSILIDMRCDPMPGWPLGCTTHGSRDSIPFGPIEYLALPIAFMKSSNSLLYAAVGFGFRVDAISAASFSQDFGFVSYLKTKRKRKLNSI